MDDHDTHAPSDPVELGDDAQPITGPHSDGTGDATGIWETIGAVPHELQGRDQWVVWREEMVEGRDKPTKVPYDAKADGGAIPANRASTGGRPSPQPASMDAATLVPLARYQNTIDRPTSVEGFGFWSGRDVRLQFRPAPPDSGIVFVRGDLKPAVRIPARSVCCTLAFA